MASHGTHAKAPHSGLAASTHDALHAQVAATHERLHSIELTEQKARLQRGIIKATAAAELAQRAGELKISNEAIGHLMALCW
ncbi:MAG: hypothetical protein U0002_08875 [Thermoanaerobaculia bacterium]